MIFSNLFNVYDMVPCPLFLRFLISFLLFFIMYLKLLKFNRYPFKEKMFCTTSYNLEIYCVKDEKESQVVETVLKCESL